MVIMFIPTGKAGLIFVVFLLIKMLDGQIFSGTGW